MKTKRKYTIANEMVPYFIDIVQGVIARVDYTTRAFKSMPGFTFFSISGTINDILSFDLLWDAKKYSLEKHIDLYAAV